MCPLIIGIIYWIGTTPLFALFRWRFKRGIKLIPCLIFIAHAVIISVTALKASKSPSSEFDDSLPFLELFSSYFICTLILGQSDVRIAVYFFFPVYLIAVVLIAIAKQRHRQLLIDSLPQDYQNRLSPVQIILEVKGGFFFGFLSLIALYLQ